MKRIYENVILNIVSTLIFTVTTQILIYPFLSSYLNKDKFGTVLTLMGVANALGVIFGGSLNNVQLLNSKKLYSEKDNGNYPVLLMLSIVLTGISAYFALSLFKGQLIKSEFIVLILVTMLITIRSYGNVYYRIKLNYNRIVKHMIFTSLGYTIGILFYYFYNNWVIIFLVGESASCLYLCLTTNIFREKLIKNEDFTSELNKYFTLATSNSLANILLYLDRLLINPILGPNNVSIYFAASIVGKMAGVILQPLSSVILSYLAQEDDSSGWLNFKKAAISSSVSGVFIFILSIPISPIIIKLLYPDLYLSAIEIYILANLSSIMSIMGSLLQPYLLKYCNLKWQNVIQTIYGFIYIGLGILLMYQFGINGFIFASLFANGIRYIMMLLIGYYDLKIKVKIDK